MGNQWNMEQVPAQKGSIAIVTGANVGLGFETAIALAGKDMQVILAARNETKANNAITTIKDRFPDAKVKFIKLDLGSLSSVRSFTETFLS